MKIRFSYDFSKKRSVWGQCYEGPLSYSSKMDAVLDDGRKALYAWLNDSTIDEWLDELSTASGRLFLFTDKPGVAEPFSEVAGRNGNGYVRFTTVANATGEFASLKGLRLVRLDETDGDIVTVTLYSSLNEALDDITGLTTLPHNAKVEEPGEIKPFIMRGPDDTIITEKDILARVFIEPRRRHEDPICGWVVNILGRQVTFARHVFLKEWCGKLLPYPVPRLLETWLGGYWPAPAIPTCSGRIKTEHDVRLSEHTKALLNASARDELRHRPLNGPKPSTLAFAAADSDKAAQLSQHVPDDVRRALIWPNTAYTQIPVVRAVKHCNDGGMIFTMKTNEWLAGSSHSDTGDYTAYTVAKIIHELPARYDVTAIAGPYNQYVVLRPASSPTPRRVIYTNHGSSYGRGQFGWVGLTAFDAAASIRAEFPDVVAYPIEMEEYASSKSSVSYIPRLAK